MKWMLPALTLTLACLTCKPATAAVNIYGPGGMSCDKYNQSPDNLKDDYKFWGQGYMSGMNSMKNLDLTRGKDQTAIFAWIDSYCKANPQSTYAGAVDSLILDINKPAS